MATNISFPNIKPTSRSYTPGNYPQVEFVAQNGAKSVIRYGNKKVDAIKFIFSKKRFDLFKKKFQIMTELAQ